MKHLGCRQGATKDAATKTKAQKEGARILAKVRTRINSNFGKGLRSTIAKTLDNRDGHLRLIGVYAEALGVNWEDAKDRIANQYAVLDKAGQPFTPKR